VGRQEEEGTQDKGKLTNTGSFSKPHCCNFVELI
jgi:hypothetical protein